MKRQDTIRYFYHEFRSNFQIGSVIYRKKHDVDAIYEKINNPNMIPTFKSAVIRDKSLLYDTTFMNKSFFEDKKVSRLHGNVRLDKYIPLLKKYYKNDVSGMPHKKVLFVPIEDYVTNTKDMNVYKGKDLKNPFEMLYTLIDKRLEDFKDIFGDYLLVFYNQNEIFTLTGKNADEETSKTIKTMMFKMLASKDLPSTKEDDDDKEVAEKEKDKQDLIEKSESILGKEMTNKLIKEDKIGVINKVINEVDDSTDDRVKDAITNEIIKTKSEIDSKKVPINQLSGKAKILRDEKLTKSFQKKNINELYTHAKKEDVVELKEKELPITVINEAYSKNTATTLSATYVKETLDKDIENILKSFGDKEEPLKLLHYEKEDTSDTLNKKYSCEAVFEDKRGKKHTIRFELPKFEDGRFMHLNGSDKLFVNQIVPFPITKSLPNIVHISTIYNKIIITRVGREVNRLSTKFKKALFNITGTKVKIKLGSNTEINYKYNTSIEYDYLAKDLSLIETKNGYIFYFNQEKIMEDIKENNIKYDFNNTKNIPIAIKDNNTVISINSDTDIVNGSKLVFLDFIREVISELIPEFKTKVSSASEAKRYMYNSAKIMGRNIPLVLILSYVSGIEEVLKNADIDYEFFENKPPKNELDGKSIIKFSDGYLVYNTYPLRNSILLNGFTVLPSADVSFLGLYKYGEEHNSLLSVIVPNVNGITEAIKNFYNLLADPITVEILEHFDLPSDFLGVLLYASALLEDNSRQYDSNMGSQRIRNAEMVAHSLYKNLATAYESYRATANNPNPVKMSIRKNAILSDIQSSRATENFSELSPVHEIEKLLATTYKGPGGQNNDRSYSDERRAYNNSMMGVLGQSSPINDKVGVSRIMSVDANVKTTRGYVEITDPKDFNKLSSSKFTSPAEALVPLSNTKDAPMRVSMTSTQSRHTISTVDASPQLIGTGMEKALAHLISNKFAYKADQNGVIESIEDEVMIVRYKDGTAVDINLGSKIRKNASGGTYIINKLETDFSVGKKIKAGDIIAYNKDFFVSDGDGDLVLKVGPLLRIGIIHSPHNFEDSCIISNSVSKRMSSIVADLKNVAMPSQSIIHHIAKTGDVIKTGDPLIIFDETDNEEMAVMLGKLTKEKETIDEIIESSKSVIKSKYDGVIEDIKIYTTVPEDELSDSIKNVIKDINAGMNKKQKRITDAGIDYPNTEISFIENVSNKNGKVKGTYVGKGILIEFYIKYNDSFGVADKLTFFSALKATVHGIFPEGQEPYIVGSPDKKIDSYLGFITIEARQTKSFLAIVATNKILYDFKREGLRNKFNELFGK